MTRNFNWNYQTAHAYGHSHVRDDAEDEREFVQRTAMMSGREYRAALKQRQAERIHEAISGHSNPDLLPNIYA